MGCASPAVYASHSATAAHGGTVPTASHSNGHAVPNAPVFGLVGSTRGSCAPKTPVLRRHPGTCTRCGRSVHWGWARPRSSGPRGHHPVGLLSSQQGRGWLGELSELLLIVAYQRREFVPPIGSDHTDALDDQLGPHCAPDELPVGAQPVEFLPLPTNEDEAEQVAAVRLEEERLKAFDLTASPRCCSWP